MRRSAPGSSCRLEPPSKVAPALAQALPSMLRAPERGRLAPVPEQGPQRPKGQSTARRRKRVSSLLNSHLSVGAAVSGKHAAPKLIKDRKSVGSGKHE